MVVDWTEHKTKVASQVESNCAAYCHVMKNLLTISDLLNHPITLALQREEIDLDISFILSVRRDILLSLVNEENIYKLSLFCDFVSSIIATYEAYTITPNQWLLITREHCRKWKVSRDPSSIIDAIKSTSILDDSQEVALSIQAHHSYGTSIFGIA
jgi:hypothetical protein